MRFHRSFTLDFFVLTIMSKVRFEDVQGVLVPRVDNSDPKRPNEIVPFDPSQLSAQASSIELQSVLAMMLSGTAMVLRQKYVFRSLNKCTG
jgi:hypothetical protein